MRVVYSEKFLLHENPFETRQRLESIKSYLDKHSKPQYAVPAKIREKELLAVHSKELLEEEKKLSATEVGLIGDNFFQKNTFEIAMLAASSALKAAKLSFRSFAFSLARPPGHHASRSQFGGFCYLNNIAFAVRAIQREKGIERAMIADFDLHHGNGTQDIFYNDESVFYLSLHQNPENTYPFKGFPGENNSHIENIVLPDSITDDSYLRLFEKSFCKNLKEFNPEMLAISAGFDIFSCDASIGNRLAIKKPETFNSVGKIVRNNFSGPIFAVLEGGYYLPLLGENVSQFLLAFE